MKQVKENNPTNRPLPPAPLQDPPSNSNGASLEPQYAHEYRQPPPLPPPQRNPYQFTTAPNQPPNDYSPLSPTMEEDNDLPPLPKNEPPRNQPRYISQSRNQPGELYNRVQRPPVVRNGMSHLFSHHKIGI